VNNNGNFASLAPLKQPQKKKKTAAYGFHNSLKSDELVGDEWQWVVEGGLEQIWRWLDFG
jgi:hypothetical protein